MRGRMRRIAGQEPISHQGTVSTAAMRIVRLLVGRPALTVTELMAKAGVTRTAVSEQLNDLMTAGYVEHQIEPLPGRGRPRHLYAATHAALVLLFASNQQLVVPAIWNAIRDAGGEKLVQKVLHAVVNQLSAHYQAKITATTPKERLSQYAAILEEEGGLVEVTAKGGQITVTKRSCPFIAMFDEERNVCAIDMELMTAIAGCPVRQVSCRHEGEACCRFEVEHSRQVVVTAQADGLILVTTLCVVTQ